MRRRNIRIGGKTYAERHTSFVEMRNAIRARFELDEQRVNDFAEFMLRSGWQKEDVESTLTQMGNDHRPAIQAFTFHNEHVLDQVYLNQGAYTHFKDTAADPNYALRHQGHTELTMRRLTPGDLLMMQAAQIHSGKLHDADVPAEQQPDYWQQIWWTLLELLIPSAQRPKYRELWDDLYVAAATALSFTSGSPVEFGPQGDLDMQLTFMDPTSRFYVGLRAENQNRRVDDGYQRGWFFTHCEDRAESCAMAAAVITCYGIDNYGRATMEGYRRLHVGDTMHSCYFDYLNRKGTATVFRE